jgi:hypothetical protein
LGDSNALRSLSLLAGRDQRWSLYQSLAIRAGVDLAPPELWLLARPGEELHGDAHAIGAALDELRRRGLVDIRDDPVLNAHRAPQIGHCHELAADKYPVTPFCASSAQATITLTCVIEDRPASRFAAHRQSTVIERRWRARRSPEALLCRACLSPTQAARPSARLAWPTAV